MFTKKYYFVLVRNYGTSQQIENYMYLQSGKFKTSHTLWSFSLMSFFPALLWQIKFRIGAWRGNNEKYFAYNEKTTVVRGRIIMQIHPRYK